MITQNEIMWDGMFEELETPLNTELSEIMVHFKDEFDVQPTDFLKLVEMWVDKHLNKDVTRYLAKQSN